MRTADIYFGVILGQMQILVCQIQVTYACAVVSVLWLLNMHLFHTSLNSRMRTAKRQFFLKSYYWFLIYLLLFALKQILSFLFLTAQV